MEQFTGTGGECQNEIVQPVVAVFTFAGPAHRDGGLVLHEIGLDTAPALVLHLDHLLFP